MTDPRPESSDRTKPRRPWRRVALVTLLGSIAAGIGATSFAHGAWHGGWHGRGWHGEMDPQAMQRRAEAMVKWWLADVDATEAQQRKIAEIATAAFTELRPLRKQHYDARRQAIEILSQPQVDRAALEAIRAQEVALAEQVSRRITQSLADAAEVLTPEQRAKLAERLQSRRGGRHG
jgi:protein CpxP